MRQMSYRNLMLTRRRRNLEQTMEATIKSSIRRPGRGPRRPH